MIYLRTQLSTSGTAFIKPIQLGCPATAIRRVAIPVSAESPHDGENFYFMWNFRGFPRIFRAVVIKGLLSIPVAEITSD